MMNEQNGQDLSAAGEIKHVQGRFNPRMFKLIAKDLYSSDLAWIREIMVQNVVGTGGKHSYCLISEKGAKLTLKNDSPPMSRDFLENEFVEAGKAFKGNDLGFFGVGRFSLWLIADNIRLTSGNTQVDWKTPQDFYLSTIPRTVKGTVYEIDVSKEFLNKYQGEEEMRRDFIHYVKENVKIPSDEFKIVFDQELVKIKPISGVFKANGPDFTVYIEEEQRNRSYSKIKVYEKRILVKSIDFAFDASITYNKEIKTLSRENLTVSDNSVKSAVLAGLKLWFDTLSDSELEKMRSKISKLLYNTGNRDLGRYLVIDGQKLTDLGTFYVTDELSELAWRAKKKGYVVLVLTDVYDQIAFKGLGGRSLEELRHILKEIIQEKAEEGGVIEEAENFVDLLKMLVKTNRELKNAVAQVQLGQIMGGPGPRVSGGAETTIIDENGEEISPEDQIAADLEAFFSGSIKIVVSEHSDPNTMAYALGNSKIGLNCNNELIKEVIEKKRFDLLHSTLIHEFTHILGYPGHDEEFITKMNTIEALWLDYRLRNEAVFENKALRTVSKVKGREYSQFAFKVPKKQLSIENVEIFDSYDKFQLIVRPIGKRKD